MIIADLQLARRLETNDAHGTADYARLLARMLPDSGADVLPIADGLAIHTGTRFPINRVIGLGLHQAVTTADLKQIERFYRAANLPPSVEVCPLAHPSLIDLLGARGYRPLRFINVSVRAAVQTDLATDDTLPHTTKSLRVAPVKAADVWAQTTGRGFAGCTDLLPPEDPNFVLAQIGFARPGALCFMVWKGAEPAGGGALIVRDGLATLYGASTLPAYRRAGIQRALLTARIEVAAAQGAELLMVNTTPGSQSARNVQRVGFRTAYTKLVMIQDGV
ncbi:MAG: GNAT family N-acetyltransferase [Chloroflexi bacterium]|nr:GNAT family N-acetyltransferase [Chloroflexota bacterium]